MLYTDNQIQEMKDMLHDIMTYELAYADTTHNGDVSDLVDGIYTYSVVGFEAHSFLPLDTALFTCEIPPALKDQMAPYITECNRLYNTLPEDEASEQEREYLDENYIDMFVQVNWNTGTIKAKVSLDYCITVFSEKVDLDNFKDQCKRAVGAF